MSKVYIPTTNIGKAHDADIYSVCITTPYTITCSGDGSIKLWSNNPTTTKINEDGTIASTKIEPDLVKFVDKSGLHHVDAFYSVENNEIGSLLIIATISFSGNIYFYKLNNALNELEIIDTLFDDHASLSKKSYWKGKFIKSDDLVISHRFIACDIKGDTYVWKLQIQDEETSKLDLKLSLQGSIMSTQPVVATCLDACVSRGLIATGFANGTVIVSQLATLRPLYTFEGYGIQGVESNSSNSVRTLQFSPGGTLLAVGNDSGSFGCVTLYETEFGERIGALTVPIGVETSHSHSGNAMGSVGTFAHNGWVFSLCFNPSGEYLVTCGYDAKCRVWDIKTKERVATLNISANDVEIEDDILLEDEQGDSMVKPAIFDVKYYAKGVRSASGSMENDSNEGICCVCMDRSIRYFREAGK